MKILIILFLSFITLSAFAMDIDYKKSTFLWNATKITGGHHGQIFLKSATVKEKKGMITGGTFIMDMKSFTVEDLKGEWANKFLTHMKSSDFFDIKKFPTATLIIQKIEKGKLHGDLIIKNKKQPISFPIVHDKNSYHGTMIFDRTKFGMIYGSGNFFKELGDKLIHDEVKVDFKVVFK